MQKVNFATGIPEIVALKYTRGVESPSNFKGPDGESIREYRFSLVDGRTMYVPPTVAEQIDNLGVAAGQQIEVLKAGRRGGGHDWTVSRIGSFREAVAPVSLAVAAPAAPERVAPRAAAPAAGASATSRLMMACLASAIDAAREAEDYAQRFGMGLTFTGEDVRAMAISLFIQGAK